MPPTTAATRADHRDTAARETAFDAGLEWSPRRGLRRHRSPPDRRPVPHGTTRRLGRCRPAWRAKQGTRRAAWRNWPNGRTSGGRGLQPRLPQATPGDPLRQAGHARAEEDPEGAALDGRAGAPGTRLQGLRVAGDHSGPPFAVEAEVHLHRLAAARDQPAHGAHPHVLQPGRRGHRPPVVGGPQPPEHPHPHRGRPAHPASVRRAAGQEARRRGLLADRVAHHGPPIRRRWPSAGIREWRRHPPGHGGGSVRLHPGGGQRRSAAQRQDHQLRPDLRHVGVRTWASS